MQRKEFERTTPEAVGIASQSIQRLLDRLGPQVTEMHGLMIMRHGKVCAEGWWAPYAPGLRHGLQSHTKTYAATAVGIACREGLLRLDERVIDIFADEAPQNPSENLQKLTVHHVLCMGCGMQTMPAPTKDWIREFLATPVTDLPGTSYMYNSVGSTLLAAMVRRRSGVSLQEYLTPRLFDKIGIDAANLRWMYMPDGTEVGGGGLYATTEDNLRLMKLYADGGVWEGERILDEEYVRRATTLQNESASEAKGNPAAADNFVGYGYQIWMCRPEGVYRADGAMGQFTIVCPQYDMLIAINETAQGAHWAQNTLNEVWKFLDELDPACHTLPESEHTALLQNRLRTLALPSVPFMPQSPLRALVGGRRFVCTQGQISLGMPTAAHMSGAAKSGHMEAIAFAFDANWCELRLEQNGEAFVLQAAMDGGRCRNILALPDSVETQLYLSAAWPKPEILEITARWAETCFEKKLLFHFDETAQKARVTQLPERFLFIPAPEGPVVFEAR